jgi:hypothetical protein
MIGSPVQEQTVIWRCIYSFLHLAWLLVLPKVLIHEVYKYDRLSIYGLYDYMYFKSYRLA